ncbi:MAG: hypothetical protein QOF51_2399 [Chloroflexota bacterium]|jgi:phosphoglycerate dehydrogenase-like enzyme|nr:hypothetical protein [Chloroflexota bacterium]
MVRVAVLDDFHRAFAPSEPLARLRQAADVTIYEEPFASEEAMVAALQGVEVAITNRERTHFTADLLRRLPDLKLISQTGTHFYHVDIAAATRQGVILANAPGGSSPSVAEMTIAFMIALTRRMLQADAAMRRGEWPVELFGSIEGKRLGILGMGKIGNLVTRAAHAFGTEVVAWGPTFTDERASAAGVRRVELDDVFRTSDFVSVHLTLSELSRGLVSRERLALMKPTGFLINTARAAITDEAALVEALRQHRIAGAALDVFMEEPLPPDSPIRQLDNVILSPHAGWTTNEAYGPWIAMTVENVLAYLAGDPIRVHNPDVLGRPAASSAH